MPALKHMIIIAGPTAVGKTAIALRMAKHLGTSVISADSRQCFREMKIGVARPSEKELNEVPHYFIASHSIHDEINAAFFEKYALERANDIFQLKNAVVVTGGTGLYLQALTGGMDEIPAVDPATREEIIHNYKEKGMEWLDAELKTQDPEYYAYGEIKNPQRMMRALEVKRATGQSILSFRKGASADRPFKILKIALDLPREELYQRINNRVDEMMDAGLLEEVKLLFPYRHLNALQTVGYKELFEFLEEKTSLESAVERIKTSTRNYAKRQLTWFRKHSSYHWLPPDEEQVWQFIKKSV